VGGFNAADQALGTVEAFDAAAGTWRTLAPMPTPRAWLGLAALDGKLYAVGGNAGGVVATVEVYDPQTDTWTAGAALPAGRDRLAAAAFNGGVYALGGLGASRVDIWRDGTWTAGPALASARGALAAVAVRGALWVIGGTPDGATSLRRLDVYRP
jgi:N-acetylneuraminic acid mutarotase